MVECLGWGELVVCCVYEFGVGGVVGCDDLVEVGYCWLL